MYSAIYTGWFEKFDYSERRADMLTGRTVYMKQNTYPIHFHQPKTNIWAIGGGKGGVGKSLIAVSFGILLSRLGNRVLLVDADLGAPNLHTFMGMENGKRTLSGFLKGKIQNIDDTVTNTPIPNLGLISGSRDPLGVADLDSNSIARLKAALKGVGHDYVLLDIGPGTSFNMLELFLLADEGILVTTTEPTSIENIALIQFFIAAVINVANNETLRIPENQLQEIFYRLITSGFMSKIPVLDSNGNIKIKDVEEVLHKLYNSTAEFARQNSLFYNEEFKNLKIVYYRIKNKTNPAVKLRSESDHNPDYLGDYISISVNDINPY